MSCSLSGWFTTGSFFFEGAIRLTEGETLSCSDPASYDRVKKGRFFQFPKLKELGEIYFQKLHISYEEEGKARGVANELAVGVDLKAGETRIIYVTRPLKYKGFEVFRFENDGYSPLFVLRDRQGNVLHGAYAPLQSIKQKDGSFIYRSGRAATPESFNFPQNPEYPAVFKLQTVYYPDLINKVTGEVSFQIWPIVHGKDTEDQTGNELFNGKAAFGERVKAGDYFLSMDEVRYWTSMNVIYRPGLPLIFGSFWIILVGVTLTLILKAGKWRGEESKAA